MTRLTALMCVVLLSVVLVGCAQSPVSCSRQPYADLSLADEYVDDDDLPFRFPLDDSSTTASLSHTNFCEASSGPESSRMYHAAEDYFRPAGTPVYAMADGEVSFSGRMSGYGWLVIVDHPQANIYSLYGHLSPSRWNVRPGPVEKGELLGYLGDSDENGGSAKNPLEPHLHLGVRAGQRVDYSGMGEWRWQAGWIKPCPADIGWLRPSGVIVGQEIPAEGFTSVEGDFWAMWLPELLFGGLYAVFGTTVLVGAIKKEKPLAVVAECALLIVAAWVLHAKGARVSYVLIAMATLCVGTGLYWFVVRPRRPR